MSDSKENTFMTKTDAIDKGKDYEYLNIANILLNLLTNKDIKNFQVASNAEDFGVLDDIILKVETIAGKKSQYAIQLKHVGKKNKKLSPEKLANPTGKFGIPKYYDSYIEEKSQLQNSKLILFTNYQLNQLKEFHVKLDSTLSIRGRYTKSEPLVNSSQDQNSCVQFDVNSANELEKRFFENFYLYINQKSSDDLKFQLSRRFQELYRCNLDVYEKYLQFVEGWWNQHGRKEMLNMEWVKKAIAIRLMGQFTRPFTFGNTPKICHLRELIDQFNVTLFREELSNELTQFWEEPDLDLSTANKIKKKFGLKFSVNNVDKINDLTDLEKTQLVWLMEKYPLIVEEDPATLEAIKLFPEGKFILLQKSNNVELENISVFRNFSDLENHHSICQTLVKKAKCCLQGKEVSLEFLLQNHEGIGSQLTTTELFKMLHHEPFYVGVSEELPNPHIERYLSSTIIDGRFLKEVQKGDQKVTVVLSYNNNQQKVEHLLSNVELTKVKDFLKSPKTKNNSILVEENCSEEDFNKICNTTKAGHHFLVTQNGNLEWIKSKSPITDLEKFHLQNGRVIESVLYNSPPRNNINVICANPGIGKSTLTKNLKNNLSPKYWPIIIRPSDISAYFRKKNPSTLESYILNKKCSKYSDFDKIVMQSFEKNNLLAYIWDGLDEVSDENFQKVLDIILDISKKGTLQWITSRSHLRDKLEKKFNVFARTILQFDDTQQERYIQHRLEGQEDNSVIINAIKENINMIKGHEVFGVPLQIYMLTELFLQDVKKYTELLKNIFSLTDLYDHFVNEKINYFYKEKAGIRDPNDSLRQILEDYKATYLKNYQRAALKLLEEKIRRKDCWKFLKKIKEDCDVFGFITSVSDNMLPEFLHHSFGEFFVASYLFENYKKIANLKEILFKERNTNIRFFFDLLMAKGSQLHIAVLYKNLSVLKEHNSNNKDRGGRNALQLACTWGQTFPLLNTQPLEEKKVYQINEKLGESVEDENQDYKDIIEELLQTCNPTENDKLFRMDAVKYADTASCLYPLVQIFKKTKLSLDGLSNFKDTATLLYYSVQFHWDHIIEMIPEVPFIKTEKRGLSLIHLCAEFDSKDCLRRLLKTEHKDTVNTADNYDVFPLTIACSKGHTAILQTLIGAGAKIGDSVYQLVHLACKGGHDEIVAILLKHATGVKGDRSLTSAIQTACLNGYDKIVRLLVDFGINVNMNTRYGTPLYIACQYNYEEIVKILLEEPEIEVNKGNKFDFTPLHIACQKDHLNVVKLLLRSEGIDVNVVDKKFTTPLHIVCKNSNKVLVELLIDSGADVNFKCKKNGLTCLHNASHCGDEEIVKILIRSGADVDCLCSKGCSPIYLACDNGHLNIVRLLLDSGVDIDIANEKNILPRQIAETKGFDEIVQLLLLR